jgi:hypothetical protein
MNSRRKANWGLDENGKVKSSFQQFEQEDFNELETWIRKTMRDKELADQIADAVRKENNDQNRSLHIKEWLEERLDQCKRLI